MPQQQRLKPHVNKQQQHPKHPLLELELDEELALLLLLTIIVCGGGAYTI
jgi:hypothetical protein